GFLFYRPWEYSGVTTPGAAPSSTAVVEFWSRSQAGDYATVASSGWAATVRTPGSGRDIPSCYPDASPYSVVRNTPQQHRYGVGAHSFGRVQDGLGLWPAG